jgi:hypothetical protein
MNEKNRNVAVKDFEGCQLPCLPGVAVSVADFPFQSVRISIKRFLAYPWNRYVKQWLKKYSFSTGHSVEETSRLTVVKAFKHTTPLEAGDRVLVRPMEEIVSTLDHFSELRGCAFLHQMHQYCGTEQRVFKIMERFLDERDYKVKKTRGMVLLENNFCNGTPVFGSCDRSCFLFWREEWLEKVD